MAPVIPGLENINWFPIIGQIVYWVSIIFLAIIILIAFGALLYYMKFRIKVTVIPMYGSGKDGIFAVGKPKRNRVRWVNHRTAWKSLYPLMNKKEREPFDSEYIYPGNQVITFELNDEWIPGRINIDKTENELRTEINPVPYYIRNWQSLTHKKNAIEFAKQSFWEENKYLFMTIATVFACCVLAGFVIYISYNLMGGGRSDINALTQAIRSFGEIQGIR